MPRDLLYHGRNRQVAVSSPPRNTLPLGGAEALLKANLRERLQATRERTLALVAPVSPEDLDRVHSPLMSPLVWDLGHIAAFEDLWLGHRAGGLQPLRGDLWEVYDAAETPRAERGDLAYLRGAEARDYMAAARARTLQVLERVPLDASADELNAGGLVWEMVIQHEQWHTETMLQTLQLADRGTFVPRRREPPPAPTHDDHPMVGVPAGPFELGNDGPGFAYDNERPRHVVEVPAYAIDQVPVTNGAYMAWMDHGGYFRREWWSDAGWEWRTRKGIERPLFWTEDGRRQSFDRVEAIDPTLPVLHVSWYEADAYARAQGLRLPSEVEWEKAAAGSPEGGAPRRFPWGDEPPRPSRATLDQDLFAPAPAGSLTPGVSAYGVLGLIGDVWEWTASAFGPYPGFRAFPYREYSEIFFGEDHRVLRGGSWATQWECARTTMRNWDLPIRRQIFAGFRCAVDLDG